MFVVVKYELRNPSPSHNLVDIYGPYDDFELACKMSDRWNQQQEGNNALAVNDPQGVITVFEARALQGRSL